MREYELPRQTIPEDVYNAIIANLQKLRDSIGHTQLCTKPHPLSGVITIILYNKLYNILVKKKHLKAYLNLLLWG